MAERTADDVEVACNKDKPVMEVYHSGLQVFDGDFKRTCPACGVGLLLVTRNRSTMRLVRYDRCTLCAQPVKYLDDKIAEETFLFEGHNETSHEG